MKRGEIMTEQDRTELELMKSTLGNDSWSKVGAILRILEIGNPSMALAKQSLLACEKSLGICVNTELIGGL